MYLAMGMTYDEYWHGRSELVIYYREAEKIKAERDNYKAWLQGAYVYEAICCAFPLYNPMSNQHSPLPYTKSPYTYGNERNTESEQEKNEYLVKKAKFENMMRQVNAKFERMAKSGETDG